MSCIIIKQILPVKVFFGLFSEYQLQEQKSKIPKKKNHHYAEDASIFSYTQLYAIVMMEHEPCHAGL